MEKGFFIVLQALKRGFKLLLKKDPLILASSTAFFTVFSISPIIVILLNLFSIFSERISRHIFKTIASTFGRETAADIEAIVNNFLAIESNWLVTVAGFVFFLFIATTLLGVVKNAVQKIWHIRPKPESKIGYHWRGRLSQAGLILIMGGLLFISLVIDTASGISLDYLQSVWPGPAIVVMRTLNILFSIVVVALWFTFLFKILPEASINWDTAFTGGALTSVLFTLGKFLLGKVFVHARVETIFGASATFALLLLFIFYCSFILYYGAAFTHEYAVLADCKICAGKHAQQYEETIVAVGKA